MSSSTRMMGRVSGPGSGPISDKDYWGDWPSKCPYNDDLNWACAIGIKYLTQIAPVIKKQNKVGIVVFDIDDTIVMGDPAKVVGIREMELGTKMVKKFSYYLLIIKLYN